MPRRKRSPKSDEEGPHKTAITRGNAFTPSCCRERATNESNEQVAGSQLKRLYIVHTTMMRTTLGAGMRRGRRQSELWLQRSSSSRRLIFPVATTTATAGILAHHGCQRRQYQQTTGLLKKEKEESQTSDDTKKGPTIKIFDITKQWNQEGGPTEFFSRLFPNTTKCEESVKPPAKSRQSSSTGSSRSSPTTSTTSGNARTTKNPSFFSQFQNVVTDALDDLSATLPETLSSNNNNKNANDKDSLEYYADMGKSLIGLLTGSEKADKANHNTYMNNSSIEQVVAKARRMSEKGDVSDKVSITDILEVSQRAALQLDAQLDEFFDDVTTLPPIHPTNLFYYLEYEDEIKNVSYKRRKHRFFPGVDIEEVDDLDQKLRLALLSYGDSLEEIQDSLERHHNYELVYCAMDSFPGKPSHFIAVKNNNVRHEKEKDASSVWSRHFQGKSEDDDALEMILVVRGTKTITDVITDLLCDDTEYRGGSAHAGILESGKYLATKHDELFKNMCKLSGKKRVNLTLVGHSLGAGAATIAGMELNDKEHLDVHVYGFGCPALLSEDLSKSTSDYVTTVVADYDLVPRMSTATMINAIMNIGSYNWIPSARRDLEEVAIEIQRRLPMVLTDSNMKLLSNILDEALPANATVATPSDKRMEPVLFPPGRIYHFYRDGFGISGNVVPCTFFNDLDMSRRMIHDHSLRLGYKLIFLDMMREQHEDLYFQFDDDKEGS